MATCFVGEELDHLGEPLELNPFDHAVLAATLVTAERLRDAGEADVSFCELDSDLQPWDRAGGARSPLRQLYDAARAWVYGDFEMRSPPRPDGW
jgi:hypothetical protein